MFPEAKVYHDGSHYIAIPKRTVRKKPRAVRQPEEEVPVTITAEGAKPAKEIIEKDNNNLMETGAVNENKKEEKPAYKSIINEKTLVYRMSRKELFNMIYEKNKNLKKAVLKKKLVSALCPYFNNKTETEYFVEASLIRIRRNINGRKNRAWKKARLAEFNYFCTFTYDDKKATEEEFRKKLSKMLSNLSVRKGWRYMGVWERGKKTDRLHFHALVHVPEGQMVGTFTEVKDYNTEKHCLKNQLLNDYFGERFGRTTFEPIEECELDQSLNYILKYIEKTGEKIVYSRGLFMYFISDINDEDVIMKMTNPHPEYRNDKYILFDNFTCMDAGEIIGRASKETIRRLRRTNK